MNSIPVVHRVLVGGEETKVDGGSVEDLGAPESWEAANLEERMKRLMHSSFSPRSSTIKKDSTVSSSHWGNVPAGEPGADPSAFGLANLAESSLSSRGTEKGCWWWVFV
ncbi:hypothetical protein Ancab_001206 [Ancistrocladus abbreviatus]